MQTSRLMCSSSSLWLILIDFFPSEVKYSLLTPAVHSSVSLCFLNSALNTSDSSNRRYSDHHLLEQIHFLEINKWWQHTSQEADSPFNPGSHTEC